MSVHRLLRALAVLAGPLAPLLLAACATGGAGAPPAPAALLDDTRFAASAEPVAAAEVFKLDDAMRRYVAEQIQPEARQRGARQALIDALYARGQLRLEYEATMTRTAAQAFEARQGNCLSLVIMTGAFAQALGLDVTFQEVGIDESWSRAGGMYFTSGHVNLVLDRHSASAMHAFDRSGSYTVDFLPPEESAGMRAHAIAEKTIVAMYMNNRAAEAMVAGHLDDAYWRAREAVRIDPDFLSAYNTLGVIYLRHADTAQAERVLRYVAERAPDNPRALANHAQALRALGRDREAAALEARLAVLEPLPPFYFFERGQAAYKAGDLIAARNLFRKELERAPDYHEFHYWLAIADAGLGRLDEARSELSLAMDDSVRRTDHDLYAAKLDRLKAYQQSAARKLQ